MGSIPYSSILWKGFVELALLLSWMLDRFHQRNNLAMDFSFLKKFLSMNLISYIYIWLIRLFLIGYVLIISCWMSQGICPFKLSNLVTKDYSYYLNILSISMMISPPLFLIIWKYVFSFSLFFLIKLSGSLYYFYLTMQQIKRNAVGKNNIHLVSHSFYWSEVWAWFS